ncbi:MAG: hypothetical protein KF764_33255 [Labilithrix sp.]|nr:hypothetical protein [Labilithrix sp.]
MKVARALFVSGFLLAAMIVACVGDEPVDNVSTSPEGGSGACTDAQKSCSGTCASKDDPNAGCASPDCTPCAAATNAAPACAAGACSFTCNAGFSDCDGNPANGCEARSSSDPANCGECGKACGSANTSAASKCEAGSCVFTCNTGFAHCVTSTDTGCETDLSKTSEHCGACGHSCLGGKCTDGKCEPFQVASVTSPRGLAVDAKSIYVTTFAPSILRVQHDGKCTPASPCPFEFAGATLGDGMGGTAAFRGPVAPVSDGTTVWWINQAGGNIGRRAVAGGTMTFLNGGPAGSGQNGHLTHAGGKLFWTNAFATTQPTTHVYMADADGTTSAIATYAAPATTFYGKGGIAADATHVYWASEKSGIFKAAFNAPVCVEGSTCTTPVTSGGASPSGGIAVDADFVYWTESTGIRKAPKTGGASTNIAIDQDAPTGIAVMNGLVYWSNTGTTGATKTSIRRVDPSKALCDGTACELVADVAQPEALVAADDGMYWLDGATSGGVYRLAK